YRTGDVARWLSAPCPCGLAFRRLSPLRGRLDEQVSCAWGNLHPEFFEPLLREVPGLASDWQVAVYERELTHVVQLRLEIDGDDAARARGVLQPLIEADEIVVRGVPVGPQESGRQLQSVRGAQRVQGERACRRVADAMTGLDLGPIRGQMCHDSPHLLLLSAREDLVPS